jgi:hypothetical protein
MRGVGLGQNFFSKRFKDDYPDLDSSELNQNLTMNIISTSFLQLFGPQIGNRRYILLENMARGPI